MTHCGIVFSRGLAISGASVARCTSSNFSPGAISSSTSPADVTEMAYIAVTSAGLVLEEIAPGLTFEDVQRATEARLIASPRVKTMPQ